MPAEKEITPKELTDALVELAELRRFSTAPKEFWPRLLAALAGMAGASKASLLVRDDSASRRAEGNPDEGGWKLIGDWPPNAAPSRLTSLFAGRLEELASACEKNGHLLVSLD